jgi:hypothetical protein
LRDHGEEFTPDDGAPVWAVAEDHIRTAFERHYIDAVEDEAKAIKNRRDAFRRALMKQMAEGRIAGQRDDRNRSLIWEPIKDGLKELLRDVSK